jgi:Cu-Zn family superoxide dismutase
LIDCLAAGAHWNPKNVTHGLLTSLVHHAGDLGNFEYTPEGHLSAKIKTHDLTLTGKKSIIGKSVVIHEKLDDGGSQNTTLSKTAGSAGARLACGSIVLDTPPMLHHKHF